MRKLLIPIVVASLVVVGGGLSLVFSPIARQGVHSAWHATMTWVGLIATSGDPTKVYWCPMDPQIKSTKENAICPICSMALVELEGGLVDAPDHLTLTAQQIQQAGVVTAPVIQRALFREIDTTGRVDYDERQLTKITSWIPGKSRIDKLYVNYKGVKVKKGQPLAEIYSPTLIVAQREYLTALDILSDAAEGSLDAELLKSARKKLKNLGLSDVQIDELARTKQPNDRLPILAASSGVVHRLNVQEGQYVSEGDVLMELVDLSKLWVFADLFEEEVPLAKLGLPVQITARHLPGEVFHGQIRFIDHMVKPGTRTVPIRMDVENTDHKLKAGMFARVVLRHNWPKALSIPASAVLWSGQRSVVIVRGGEGTFRPHEVQIGRKWLYAEKDEDSPARTLGFGNDRVRYHEVLAGVDPGADVVTSGAFLLNAESQFQSVLKKMLPPASEQVPLEKVVGPDVAKKMRGVLEAYFRLSETLADDKLKDVPARLLSLSETSSALIKIASEAKKDKLSEDAKLFHALVVSLSSSPPKDAVDARRRFGLISHELTTLLTRNGGRTLFGKELYQFECGMAKVGYERWLWSSPETHNPYMGKKMLKCGKRLDVFEP